MFDLTSTVFKNISVSGDLASSDGNQFENCNISSGGLLNIGSSVFLNCIIGGTNSIKDGAISELKKCSSPQFGYLEIDFANPTIDTNLHLSDFSGELVVQNMNNDSFLHASGNGKVTLANTCASANVKLAGNIKYDDQGSNTFLTDNRIETASDTQDIIDAINASETNVLDAIGDIPNNILDVVLDGTATVRIALQRVLAYCNGKIVRLGSNYSYRNFDDTADVFDFDVIVTPGGHTRTRTDPP